MGWIATKFEGLWVYEPKIFEDKRGYFLETYNERMLPDSIKQIRFVQDNESKSSFGVIRGLHYQLPPYAQSKLVRAVTGEVLDVVVDIRSGSKTYGNVFNIILNDINKKQLFVPHGFAHGYAVLSEEAIFSYKCDQYYAPEYESGIIYNDKALKIDWLIPDDLQKVSEKDMKQSPFDNLLPFSL
ncbi:MAG: dTDP-4-dehydrorhamnose 3,5-epimerase [Saprospiraceae bacterium]|nr:dTDP-4-dehydrorhamnose 3,5-epimerase [Saprospiraceae bacterium]